jgi:uncharacterized protein YqgV (UPF0045/DUF77 family)
MPAEENVERSIETAPNAKTVDARMTIEVEASLYPLVEEYLEHPVHDFVDLLKKHGCKVEVGPMSLVVEGRSSQVFEALRLGYEEAARKSGCVLLIKVCNVCAL